MSTTVNIFKKRLDRLAPVIAEDERPCNITLDDGTTVFDGTLREFKAIMKTIDGKTRSAGCHI